MRLEKMRDWMGRHVDPLYVQAAVFAALVAVLVYFSHGSTLEQQHPGKRLIRFEREDMFPEEAAAWRELIARFERTVPDVKVIMSSSSRDETSQIREVAGKLPDVVCSNTFRLYSRRKNFLDLTPLVRRDRAEIDFDDFYPTLIDTCSCEGRLLVLPYFYNVSLLYYNVDWFEAAGVELPREDWDYDDYLAAAKKLTEYDETGRPVRWGSGVTTTWWLEWLTHIHMAGGEFIRPDWRACLIDRPEGVAGLTLLRDKILRHKVSPRPQDLANAPFLNEVIAMEYAGHTASWVVLRHHAKFRWDVTLLPQGLKDRHGGERVSVGLGVNPNCADRELAWQFVKFATGKEGITRLVRAGIVPVRKSVTEAEFLRKGPDGRYVRDPQNKAVIFQALEHTREQSRLPEFTMLCQLHAQPYVAKVVRGQMTPAAAAREIARECNAILRMLDRRNPDYRPPRDPASAGTPPKGSAR